MTTRVCQTLLSEIWTFAWNGCFSDLLWPPDLWLQPDVLKGKSGFGKVPPPGSIIYMTAPSSFVWHSSPTHRCSVRKAEKGRVSWRWSPRRAQGTGEELLDCDKGKMLGLCKGISCPFFSANTPAIPPTGDSEPYYVHSFPSWNKTLKKMADFFVFKVLIVSFRRQRLDHLILQRSLGDNRQCITGS